MDMIALEHQVSCIGEVVDGTVVDVFFDYLIAKYNN